MEDSWLSVNDGDNSSSHHDSPYSDKISSDIEAELYSTICYQENLSSVNNPDSEDFINACISGVNYSTYEINNISYDENRSSKNSFKSFSENSAKSFDKEKNLLDKQKPVHKTIKNFNVLQKQNFNHDLCSTVSCSDDLEDKDFKVLSKRVLSSNKKLKKTNYDNSQKRIHSSKENKSIIIDSSDSDSSSVIRTEVNCADKSNFTTNLFNDMDTMSLNGDVSNSSLNISHPSKSTKSVLSNLSMPNIKIGESSKDIWYINDEDLYRLRKSSRRYHESSSISKPCLMPKVIKCFVCGGSHLGSWCRKRICGKCYCTGHDSKRCWMPYISYCLHCNMKGHAKKDCPDIWRRYHLTTGPTDIIQSKPVKQDKILYCWNCGKPGHFGAVCKEFRFSKSSFPTWPCVISYDYPEELLTKRLNRKKYNAKNAMHLNKEELNSIEDIMPERKNEEKKRRRRNYFQYRKEKKWLSREINFPRTPPVIQNKDTGDILPDSVCLELKVQQRKKERNRMRKLKKKQNKLKGGKSLCGNM